MKRLSLVPYLSRDYKSKAAIEADLLAGKDFTIADCSNAWDGRPINLPQIREYGYTDLNVRYRSLTQVAVIDLSKLGKTPAPPAKPAAKRISREEIQAFRSEALEAGNTDLYKLCGAALNASGTPARYGLPSQKTAMAKVSAAIRKDRESRAANARLKASLEQADLQDQFFRDHVSVIVVK